MSNLLTYLCVPYSHPDERVRVERFEAANRAAGILMRAGHKVYSPISHSHPIAVTGNLPIGWDYWQAYDRIFLGVTGLVVVLMLEGWRESKGIQGELEIAEELYIPTVYRRECQLSELLPIPG